MKITAEWLDANPDYTCHCGLPVHPSKSNANAIHIRGCQFETIELRDQKINETANEIYDRLMGVAANEIYDRLMGVAYRGALNQFEMIKSLVTLIIEQGERIDALEMQVRTLRKEH